MNSSPSRLAPVIKLTALLIVLALHLFHPAGQAAALPLSLLVLGGAWLTEASIAGAGNWTSTGMSIIGAATMPFYLGVLVFNTVISTHLPLPVTAGHGPMYVSASRNSGPVPSGAQSGCGSGCGGGSGGCSASGGGCGSSAGGCGSGCGSSKKGTVAQLPVTPGQRGDVTAQMNAQLAAIAKAKSAPPALTTPGITVPPAIVEALKKAAAAKPATPAAPAAAAAPTTAENPTAEPSPSSQPVAALPKTLPFPVAPALKGGPAARQPNVVASPSVKKPSKSDNAIPPIAGESTTPASVQSTPSPTTAK